MEDVLAIIKDLVVPVTLAGCYALGAALKTTEKFNDKYIPITMFVAGGIITPLVTGVWTTESIIIGCISGWASTGLHQTIKQLSEN